MSAPAQDTVRFKCAGAIKFHSEHAEVQLSTASLMPLFLVQSRMLPDRPGKSLQSTACGTAVCVATPVTGSEGMFNVGMMPLDAAPAATPDDNQAIPAQRRPRSAGLASGQLWLTAAEGLSVR